MDPEFGDGKREAFECSFLIYNSFQTDLLNGFSDEEVQYGEGEGEHGASGLDLLTAMLDSQANKKQEAKRSSSSRKRSINGHKKWDSQDEEGGGVKRRKITKREKIDHSEKSTESANDEVSQLKGKCTHPQKNFVSLN